MTWDHRCRHCGKYLDYDWRMLDGHERFVAWCNNPECYGEVEESKKAKGKEAAEAAEWVEAVMATVSRKPGVTA